MSAPMRDVILGAVLPATAVLGGCGLQLSLDQRPDDDA